MYKNILVPVSFDESRNMEAAIAAAKLLADEGASITLFHVIEAVPAYAMQYVTDEFRAESRKAVIASLTDIAAKVPGGKAAVVTGHSGRTILDWADEHDVDCVVIASHRPGMQDYLLGSTAAQVVRHAKCSVHVIR